MRAGEVGARRQQARLDRRQLDLAVTRHGAEYALALGPPMTLVVNKLPRSGKETRIDIDGLAELGSATRVAAGDFAWRDAPENWRRSIAELAVVLSADWPRLSLAT